MTSPPLPSADKPPLAALRPRSAPLWPLPDSPVPPPAVPAPDAIQACEEDRDESPDRRRPPLSPLLERRSSHYQVQTCNKERGQRSGDINYTANTISPHLLKVRPMLPEWEATPTLAPPTSAAPRVPPTDGEESSTSSRERDAWEE